MGEKRRDEERREEDADLLEEVLVFRLRPGQEEVSLLESHLLLGNAGFD